MPGEMGMRGPKLQKLTAVDKALDDAGIAGRIYKSSGELVWTHGTWNDYTEETRPKTPLLVVRKSDYEMIEYNMKKGRDPQVEVDIEHIFTYREMPQSNVIAEIVGTEKPEEVVIISGHFDSWNGPGSTGASDNGTGSSSTIEAARILKAVGAEPKRTIRFILWSGEEQGLLGSRAYVEAHKDELDNISAIFVEDSGQNWQSGVGGLPEMMPMLSEALKPMANAFDDMPVKPHEVKRLSRGGSDHGSFVNKGVPGFFLNKGGSLSYRHVWHTQNDKPSEVPEKNIRQMSTNMAVIAYNLACADDLMPRVALGRTTAHPAVGGYFAEDDHDFCKCGQILEVGYQLSRRGF
jgi:Zn-dependent M28 family amino/carboxypeptidase